MKFPVDEIQRFLESSSIAVNNANCDSKRLANMRLYEEVYYDLLAKVKSGVIHFYGSRIMGLANPNSDLDVFIDLYGSFHTGNRHHIAQKLVKVWRQKLQNDKNWSVKIALPEATVPVLRCIYLPKMLKCDIVFSNGLGVVTSKLVKHLFNIQPEAIKFLHAIEIWLDIAGPEAKFKRSQLTILVVFFLQTQNMMPSIVKVQNGLRVIRIDGWQVQYDVNRTLQRYGCEKMEDFKDSLIDFFRFYMNFDFDRMVVCPNYGFAISKKMLFDSLDVNHPEFHILDKAMVITSFLSYNYNVTYDVGKNRVKDFKDMCRDSYAFLHNNVGEK